jgi:heptosyltransferase-3
MALDAQAPLRVLIVRRDNIGDLVCTTPLLAALRAQLPRAWIGALITTYNAEVLARNPAVDELFVYEKLKHRTGSLFTHVRRRIGQLSQLRSKRLDCVLVPAPAPQSLKLARSFRPGRVIAASTTFPAGIHEVERTFELGRSLGLSGKPGAMRVLPDPALVQSLRSRLGEGPMVAVHVSARRPAQRWPLARYVELIRTLAGRGRVLLLWSPGAKDDPRHPGDDEAAAEIARAVDSPALLPLATPDLRMLIAALSLAERVLCPDGGAMHLAAALGKPVVALFGDSPPARWRPWGVAHRVVRPESGDLADLPLAPVLDAYAALG